MVHRVSGNSPPSGLGPRQGQMSWDPMPPCAAARALVLTVLALGIAHAQPEVAGTPVELATLRYIDIAQGTGAPAAAGKRYTVHYTGWLKDGTKFDSSVERNEPLDFVQGRRQVISGWDMGFEGMKVGGKRRLFIPY